jgi:hypothetical protein
MFIYIWFELELVGCAVGARYICSKRARETLRGEYSEIFLIPFCWITRHVRGALDDFVTGR